MYRRRRTDRDPESSTERWSRDAASDADFARQWLRELFDLAPGAGPSLEAGNDHRKPRGISTGEPSERPPPDRRGEADMFAIAFACCREMLLRLSEHLPAAHLSSASGQMASQPIADAADCRRATD